MIETYLYGVGIAFMLYAGLLFLIQINKPDGKGYDAPQLLILTAVAVGFAIVWILSVPLVIGFAVIGTASEGIRIKKGYSSEYLKQKEKKEKGPKP